MTLQEARDRMLGDLHRRKLEALVWRSDELIQLSRQRIADHLELMNAIGKHDAQRFADWRALHQNFERGLKFLIEQREMVVRELAYIDRQRLRYSNMPIPDSIYSAPSENA